VSKALAPGIRLGWLVLPGHLAEPMAAAKIAAEHAIAEGVKILARVIDRM
jgi:DNA-binding transcriptional MocR family regulator